MNSCDKIQDYCSKFINSKANTRVTFMSLSRNALLKTQIRWLIGSRHVHLDAPSLRVSLLRNLNCQKKQNKMSMVQCEV